MKAIVRAFAVLFALLVSTAQAQAPQKRVALIIGNTNYQYIGSLSNPVNDAMRMARFLESRGFSLIGGRPQLDRSMRDLLQLAREYGRAARGADVTFFYFSGHGMQINGINYLLPVDTDGPGMDDLDSANLNANFVMDEVAQARSKFNLFFLDACRNNPFKNRRVSSRTVIQMRDGLAEMRPPTGTLIGFATQPGNVAADGPAGGNSPYAAALLESMEKPGYDQFRVVNEAANLVLRRTNGRQEPWMLASAISGIYYFTQPLATGNATPVAPVVAAVLPPPAPQPTPAAAPSQSPGTVSLNYAQEANHLFEQYRYADGRSILTQGINAGQRTAINYSYRGYAWFQDGLRASDPEVALSYFRSGFDDLDKAIEIEKTYPNSYRHRGNMIAATWKVRKRLGKPVNRILDAAIRDLKTAADLDPTSMSNAYYLGEAYNLRGEGSDYSEAIRWFNTALSINPKFVAPHSGLCYAYRMTGNIAMAQQEAAYAASRDSDQANKSCLYASAINRYVPKF